MRSSDPSSAATVDTVQAGDVIDHYRLIRDLGAGAFATVWLARDEFLDDDVAIKVLADNWARNDDVRRRFVDEAKILRRIDHERIVRVFALTELRGGQPAFVMTYADRGTLADRIHERRSQARRFGLDEVAALGVELATCLAVVHDFGVVHRDVKPSNVLFRTARRDDPTRRDSDAMVLADFGLAKDTVAASGFTMAAGTPAYMPPEQAHTSSELDHRADIYAATAILFELLTGAAPFNASSLSGVGRSRSGGTQRLDELRTDIPPVWQRVIDRGLAPHPSDRFDSASDFAEAITAAARASGVFVVEPSRIATANDQLTGVRRRVDDIIRRFDAERSAGVDRRLRGACTIGVVGSDHELAQIGQSARLIGLDVIRLAIDDVRVGDCDLVVLGAGHDTPEHRRALTELLAESPAGPLAVVSAAETADVERLLSLVSRRADMIRASAALAILDATVQRAGSVALSDSWVRVGDLVESVRFDLPAFGDLAALRSETAGRILLPLSMRTELHTLLMEVDATARLGLASDADESIQLDAAITTLSRWREFQDSGRVPFTSRDAVETVVRSIERLWAMLVGHS